MEQKPAAEEQVTRTQQFAARVVKFGPTAKLVMASPAFYQNEVNKFRDGDHVTLYLSNKRPKRTLQQNRYYWGVYLPLIAEQTGERDLDRLHELFKGRFLTTEVVEVLGHKVRMKKSTTELSTSDFSAYIMDIEAETGIAAPPTEAYNLEPLHANTLEQRKKDESVIHRKMSCSPNRQKGKHRDKT